MRDRNWRTLGLCLLAAAIAAAGCSGPQGPVVSMRWDPGNGVLGAFPDDALTRVDPSSRTGLRLDAPAEAFALTANLTPMYRDVFRDLSALDGFGPAAGMFVRFEGALDPTSVRSGPSTREPDAPILLLVERGGALEPWPYEARLIEDDHALILDPMLPLPPRAKAAIVVTRRLKSASGATLAPSPAMERALRGESGDPRTARVATRVAQMAGRVQRAGFVVDKRDLVGVVVFTTQSIHHDALAIAAHVASRPVSPTPGTQCEAVLGLLRCNGSLEAIDYRGATGVIEDLGVAGAEVQTNTRYLVGFTAWMPLSRPGPFGGEAYPTLIFGHGLGGQREHGEALAKAAVQRGIAVIAIDAPRHGAHPTATAQVPLLRTLDFFGVDTAGPSFRPLNLRDNFRQASFDKLQLAQMLRGGVDLDGDDQIDLDASRLLYLGVSLGGIMGPEFLALEPAVRAAVLVVGGARVGNIVSDAPAFSLLIDLMKPADVTDAQTAMFFPVLQTLLDRGDPAQWAPHLLDAHAAGLTGAAPHLLMAMVLDDDTVPPSSNRALARALEVPLIAPVRHPISLLPLADGAPVAGNLTGGRTAGLLQFDRLVREDGSEEPATHANLTDSAIGQRTWLTFFQTFLETGTPRIIDPYAPAANP